MFKYIYYTDDILEVFKDLPTMYKHLQEVDRSVIFKSLLFFDLFNFASKKDKELFNLIKYDDEILNKGVAFLKFNNYPYEFVVLLLCYFLIFNSNVKDVCLKEVKFCDSYFFYDIATTSFYSKFFSYFTSYLGFEFLLPSILDKARKKAIKISKKKYVLSNNLNSLDFSIKDVAKLLDSIYIKKI